MIPNNITRQHVLMAIEEIDRFGVPPRRHSRKYLVEYEGKTYPPKYVLSLANKYANGTELDPSTFFGGDQETNGYLRALAFRVVRKGSAFSSASAAAVTPRFSSSIQQSAGTGEHSPGAVLAALRRVADDLANRGFSFARTPEADALVQQDPFAYCLAACVDRQATAERVWSVPLSLRQQWGHLEPQRIAQMPISTVAASLRNTGCGWRLRMEDVARTVIELATLVTEACGGDANRLFQGTVPEMLARFESIFGVGNNIANMAVLLRIRYFRLRPEGMEALQVKRDKHVIPVFYRVGFSDAPTEAAALAASADLTPEDRILADQGAWHIGRTYCHESFPACDECPVGPDCPKVGIR